MDLNQVIRRIDDCVLQMNARYSDIVFNEWAIVAIGDRRIRLLNYKGKRPDFMDRFLLDAGALRHQLFLNHQPGYFAFDSTGVGTGFESFVSLGSGLSLIWNHTLRSMDDIRQNPRWIASQASFADLTDRLCIDPVTKVGL
jgi:hypothetical protein